MNLVGFGFKGIKINFDIIKPTSIEWVFCLENFLSSKRINTEFSNFISNYF